MPRQVFGCFVTTIEMMVFRAGVVVDDVAGGEEVVVADKMLLELLLTDVQGRLDCH